MALSHVTERFGTKGSTVTVTVQGGGNATLFSDAAGTVPLANPVTVTANGHVDFYVANGTYVLTEAGNGTDKRTITVGTPSQFSDAQRAELGAAYASKALLPNRANTVGLTRLLDMFAPIAGDLCLARSGSDYVFLYGWGQSRYWATWLRSESGNPGGYALRQLQRSAEVVPMLTVDDDSAGVVYVGSYTQGGNAAAYGTDYKYSTTAGNTATWTTPSNVTKVGARVPWATNGGLAKVTIDGSATAANLLPTAQQLVTAGTYPNTILVANGGTLNPTDRVLNTYLNTATTYDNLVAMADNLTAGVHTVVFTTTGYIATGGSTGRTYLGGLSYTKENTLPTDAGVTLFEINVLNNSLSSAYEYALLTLPTVGGVTATFLGSIHGYEVEDSLTFTVDGVPATPADGSFTGASSNIEVTRVSHLLHPDTASTVIANITTVYRLDRNGLTVTPTITWAVAATISAAYVMAPVNGSLVTTFGNTAFTKGTTARYGGIATLPGAGDLYYAAAKSYAAWTWGGNYGLLMWLPDVETWTNNWLNSNGLFSVEDRNGTITKLYCGRLWSGGGLTETVAPGTVWTAETHYLAGRFPATADAVLAA